MAILLVLVAALGGMLIWNFRGIGEVAYQYFKPKQQVMIVFKKPLVLAYGENRPGFMMVTIHLTVMKGEGSIVYLVERGSSHGIQTAFENVGSYDFASRTLVYKGRTWKMKGWTVRPFRFNLRGYEEGERDSSLILSVK